MADKDEFQESFDEIIDALPDETFDPMKLNHAAAITLTHNVFPPTVAVKRVSSNRRG